MTFREEHTAMSQLTTANPADLLVGPNVRRDVVLSKEFVASITLHGVKVPITAQHTLLGLEVVDGQRRTLAAVDAGLTEVPVFVIDAGTDAERIVQQLVVNEHRAGITAADEVAAIKQLALFDLTVAAIAKKTGLAKGTVQTAITVAGSETAAQAMKEHQVTLDAAAVIAEFEGDEVATAELVDYASKGYNIEHLAQRHRDRRGEEEVAAQIEATPGLSLIERPSYDTLDAIELRGLFTDTERKTSLADLPHEEVLAIAGDGLCGFPLSGWADGHREYTVAYAVKGWRELGLHTHEWRSGKSDAVTPEAAERARAEKRRARETTKAWVTATAVRLAFLQELLQRKTMPAGWEAVVAYHIVATQYNGVPSSQWKLAGTLLQLEHDGDSYSFRSTVEKYLVAHLTRAAHVALAASLAGVEGAAEFDRKGWSHKAAAGYLARLSGWGYQLSDVEQNVLGGSSAR